MEIELKYIVAGESTMESIWHDAALMEYMDEDTRSEEEYEGSYYDTADFRLMKNDIAYRIRREGRIRVACLKWSGKIEGPLHSREELNVTLCGDDAAKAADPTVFSQSKIGEELLEVLDEEPLHPIMEVSVLRRACKLDTGKAIMELSLDTGTIRTEKGEEPISELEIELYSGEKEELLRIGEELAERYHLEPETRSKYARGLALLGMTTQ